MTSATAVCKRGLLGYGEGSIGFMVADLVDDFLFPDNITVIRATTMQDHRLIRRLGHEPLESIDEELMRSQDVNYALDTALELRNIELAKTIVESFPRVCITTGIQTAASFGQTAFLQWLHDRRPLACWGGTEMMQAAQFGHIQTLRWLHENIVPIGQRPRLLGMAARNGDVALLDFAVRSCGEVPILRDLNDATGSGCLEVVVKLSALFPDARIHASRASTLGHLDVIQWLHTHNGIFTRNTMDEAASQGHLHVVKWLHTFRTEGCTRKAVVNAALNGHLETVKWILGNRSEGCSRWAMERAIQSQNIDVMQALYDYRAQGWRGALVDTAAKTGSLKLVSWTYNIYPETCTPQALAYAALAGNKEVFNWLHSRLQVQCPSWVMADLAFKGDLDMMQDERIDMSESRVSAMQNAARCGHLHVLEWIYHPSVHDEELAEQILDDAASAGQLDAVKWLHSRRMPCTERAMDGAATNGHFFVVLWLSRRPEGCTADALSGAAEGAHFSIMEHLNTVRREGCHEGAVYGAAKNGYLEVLQWLKFYYPEIVMAASDSIIEYADVHGWGQHIVQELIGEQH